MSHSLMFSHVKPGTVLTHLKPLGQSSDPLEHSSISEHVLLEPFGSYPKSKRKK